MRKGLPSSLMNYIAALLRPSKKYIIYESFNISICHTYRIYSNRRRGVYFIFRDPAAAFIQKSLYSVLNIVLHTVLLLLLLLFFKFLLLSLILIQNFIHRLKKK